MISHKHKCVFVHGGKAAAISNERVYKDNLGMDMGYKKALEAYIDEQ